MYLGEVSPTPAKTTWAEDIFTFGKTALALKQQRDIQSINLDRLRRGLSPLDASDVAVGAKIAMDQKQLNKLLWVAGGGIGLIALILLSRGRR